MARHYPGINLNSIDNAALRDVLKQIDVFLRDVTRQLSTQSTAGSSSSSGIVTSISEDGGTDLQGDVNLVSGTAISLSQSGQDITVASTAATISSDTPTTVNAGDTGAAGSGTSASADDHEHPVATAAPIAVGNANAEGNSTSLARANHVHAGGQSTYTKAFIATGDTLTVPTINHVVVCEKYEIQGTGSMELEGTALLCVIGGAA